MPTGDPDFDIVGYAVPFIKKKKMERMSISRITEDFSSLSAESLQLLQKISRDSIAFIRQARKGKFVLGVNIQKLEKILDAYKWESHKNSVAMIISSLIIASSLLFSFKASPQIFGLSLLGMGAIACAIVLWLWLFVRPGK